MLSLKRLIPIKAKRILKKFIISKNKNNYKYNCPVCESKTNFNSFPYKVYFEKFYENEFVYSPFQFETLNLKHYRCATCGASDRERLMALYLNEYLNKKTLNTLKLLDFAPVKALPKFLKKFDAINYRSADLNMSHVDDKVDITNMNNYSDESFDVFICSHVLEHIENDIIAMKELYRITKKGGIGLCLVPIMLSLDKSVEDKKYLINESLRWKYFGQDDHVRMYSKNDFIDRLKSVGFKVEEVGIDSIGEINFQNCGLDKKSILYVVKK